MSSYRYIVVEGENTTVEIPRGRGNSPMCKYLHNIIEMYSYVLWFIGSLEAILQVLNQFQGTLKDNDTNLRSRKLG